MQKWRGHGERELRERLRRRYSLRVYPLPSQTFSLPIISLFEPDVRFTVIEPSLNEPFAVLIFVTSTLSPRTRTYVTLVC